MQINKKILLKGTNISIGYKSLKAKKVIAKNLTFSLEKGSLTCLIGPNGVGKSTLLKTILKIIPIIDGEISFFDRTIQKINSQDMAKNVSVVLTDKITDNPLTVFDIVASGRQPYSNCLDSLNKTDIEYVNKGLKLTETQELSKELFFELSDGQKQRVLIARALAQNTPCILLDEPTAHLDLAHKVSIFLLLKKLATVEEKTILVSTHEIHYALEIANQIWLFTKNYFIQDSPDNIISSNRISDLFENVNIFFDKNTKRFVLRNNNMRNL